MLETLIFLIHHGGQLDTEWANVACSLMQQTSVIFLIFMGLLNKLLYP